MTTLFPAALDDYSDPAAGDPLTGHAQKHTDLNDAVEAIEAKLGVDGSLVAGTVDFRLVALESAPGGLTEPVAGLQFDIAAPDTDAVGNLKWNPTDGTLDLGLAGGNVTLQIGQEQVFKGLNKTGASIAEGTVVYITGAQGNRATIALAKADVNTTSNATIGITTETIANNQEGYVTVQGLVRNINTASITEGAQVFLSATTAGAYTGTRPDAPGHGVLVGFCIRSHASVGSVYVHVTNGFDLGELHDVLLTSLTNGDMLVWDSAIPAWKNVSQPVIPAQFNPIAGTNMALSGTYPDITFNASGGTSIAFKQVTVDFGAVPVYSKSVVVTDAEVLVTSKLLVTAHADNDELEMDGFSCAAMPAAGSFTLMAHAIPGPVTGSRTFNYLIG